MRLVSLGLVLLLTLAACVQVTPRPRYPAGAEGEIFISGTLEEAAVALDIKVPRTTYLPPGSVLEAVTYSVQPDHRWIVQRYIVDNLVFYILAEVSPPVPRVANQPMPQIEEVPKGAYEVTVHGRPALLLPLSATDGGIAEWILTWVENNITYNVGGEIPAELLIEIAAGLR